MESLPVPSVQATVAYLRPEAAVNAVTVTTSEGKGEGEGEGDGEGDDQIPIIDFQRMLVGHGEELARLHRACQEWGFFQLVNHGIPCHVVEGMKACVQGFFGLPAETKEQFAQERGHLEGYGQPFVVSEDQMLDWAGILYLSTQPPQDRNMRFWPDQPANLRSHCRRSLSVAVSLCLISSQQKCRSWRSSI